MVIVYTTFKFQIPGIDILSYTTWFIMYTTRPYGRHGTSNMCVSCVLRGFLLCEKCIQLL